ncbi:fungal-specific transcription factor domain-containing protein [Colletotrichum zoysiae]|uniref:Fungal-specific transcription factor domain-containing protein n=1 Tax=Colletotrichum zoysiae TaxID=1216348 RepID=A0AAD9HNX5_9PEZI|nr:fungal-specific transcription factor domain-containing protein [Colletotrichum zoysiae]
MPPELQERQRRRKIALACEPCRERKARCDGGKPICSTCRRRSLDLEQCVYKAGNARTACSDDYTKTLHERIRKLEQACISHGIDITTLEATEPGRHSPLEKRSSSAHESGSVDAPGMMEPPPVQLPSPYSCMSMEHSVEPRRVTAMGTIFAEDHLEDTPDHVEDDFYGSSSAVSFLKEAYSAMNPPPSRAEPSSLFRNHQQALPVPERSPFADFDKFLLPPRPFADHLIQIYFSRVHYLYPVFHRPAFEHAYQTLWRPATAADADAAANRFRGVGLGSSPGADARTIVFHGALNSMFALACNYADLTPAEKARGIEVFLLRSRQYFGIDLLDQNNLGVVQTLLLCGLVMQGTPFPDRCWNAVGIACRIAQGLGLHMEAARQPGNATLEKEIRRRTWQGCVIVDTLVSMTYGRPTVAACLAVNDLLPRPQSMSETDAEKVRLQFNSQSFKLSLVLEDILCKIYQPWRNRHQNERLRSSGAAAAAAADGMPSLDTIVELDTQLDEFERAVPRFLSWQSASPSEGLLAPEDPKTIAIQKHVLQARFLYVRLILHRPFLTKLSAAFAKPRQEPELGEPAPRHSPDKGLRAPFTTECARVCVDAASQLITLVNGSYQTDTSGAWWWNSLYACAAGLVLIVCRMYPPLWARLDHAAVAASWEHCQEILKSIANVSVSARKSLDLLRKIDRAVTQLQTAREPSGEQIDPSLCADVTRSWSSLEDIDVSLLLDPDPMSLFRGWEMPGFESFNP